jgi:hypothetical protein
VFATRFTEDGYAVLVYEDENGNYSFCIVNKKGQLISDEGLLMMSPRTFRQLMLLD